MELEKLEAAVEAILFTMGDSVEVGRIAAAIEQDVNTTKKNIQGRTYNYQAADRGIRILELEDAYQLCTKKDYYEYLIRIARQPRKYVLTDVILETMAIVAYKQPVTRQEIEKIRGVKSDHAVNKLMEYGLVEEVGRLDAPGRPILFGTTEEFLRNFGVSSLSELPPVPADRLAEFEAEALREAGVEQEGVERPEEKEAIRENGENQEEENEPGADSSRRNEIGRAHV